MKLFKLKNNYSLIKPQSCKAAVETSAAAAAFFIHVYRTLLFPTGPGGSGRKNGGDAFLNMPIRIWIKTWWQFEAYLSLDKVKGNNMNHEQHIAEQICYIVWHWCHTRLKDSGLSWVEIQHPRVILKMSKAADKETRVDCALTSMNCWCLFSRTAQLWVSEWLYN